MSENKTHITVGGNLTTLLLVLFVGLKLAGIGVVAGWSWWWVLSPAWIPLVVLVVFFIGLFLAYVVKAIFDEIADSKRRKKYKS